MCPSCKMTENKIDSEETSSNVAEILVIVKQSQKQFSLIDTKLENLTTEVLESQKAISFCTDQVTDITKKIDQMELKLKNVDRHEEEIITLKNEMNLLKRTLDDQNQRARSSNVEIRNLPQHKNENLVAIMRKISDAINYKWENEDIEFISRVATRDSTKIKPIVMKFQKKQKKEDFLSLFKKMKGVSTEDIGLAGQKHKIFASDHLTIENKALLRKVKAVKEEKGFLYVWVTDCKILVRKGDDSAIFRIQCEEDLTKMK